MRSLALASALAAAVSSALVLLAGCRTRPADADTERRAAAAPVESAVRAARAARDTGLIASALARRDLRWVHRDTEHLRLYAPQGSVAEAQLDTLGAEAERARAAGLALLGVADYPERIALLFVPSRETMRELVGWPAGGWGVAAEHGAFFVANDSLAPALRHELMHVLSWNLWGAPFGGEARGQWISEGLATYVVGGCQDIGLHTLAAAHARAGQLVPWAAMPSEFDARTLASYVQAGSVLQFVRERFGADGLERLWREGLPGLVALSRGPAGTLEMEWRAALDAEGPLPTGEDLAAFAARIRREGCERRPAAP